MSCACWAAACLQHLAPEIAEEADYQRLLAEERRARAETKLFFRPRGDGSTDLNARLPDPVASRLRTYLDGYTSPRHKRLGEVDVFEDALRIALNLLYPECTTVGCSIPASWCPPTRPPGPRAARPTSRSRTLASGTSLAHAATPPLVLADIQASGSCVLTWRPT